ncbi:hypothetical protein P154DRAFT_536093 [Amniculicola lignicola CBS 123094]|uniref:Uncharacterized protein n=1 Tax=Amniculicola lignicola CBS 123094 TaxID=1392246 RepID=A0A6A5WF57_9PLEO|nr:hypothetical protein P154DRAFT_536093 [Amniculicola lignicola CBS 123094]
MSSTASAKSLVPMDQLALTNDDGSSFADDNHSKDEDAAHATHTEYPQWKVALPELSPDATAMANTVSPQRYPVNVAIRVVGHVVCIILISTPIALEAWPATTVVFGVVLAAYLQVTSKNPGARLQKGVITTAPSKTLGLPPMPSKLAHFKG